MRTSTAAIVLIQCCCTFGCASSSSRIHHACPVIVHASTTAAFIAKTSPTPSVTGIAPTICTPPPTGAIYKKIMPIPVIGKQCFRLHILSEQRAHLRIDGVLQVDEVLDYEVKPCGTFQLLIPDKLKKVLRQFRTSLVEFGYDRKTDLPYFVVRPPLPAKIRVQLVRQQVAHTANACYIYSA